MDTTTHHDLQRSGPPPGDPVVTARGLVCRYGRFTAVDGIELTVRRGELFALLGTNGAGKTTTLEVLEGQRHADAGTVRVLGADPLTARRRLAARVGVVFQRSGLPQDLTALEVLSLWRHLTPDAPRHADPARLLDRVALTSRADVRVRQLSGGERRRLDLALALAHDPELVFLDEPTTGLDPEVRQRTWTIIRELLEHGVTVVLTTHYLEEAELLADRLAILHRGTIAAEGTLEEMIATSPARISARLPRDAPPPPALGETHRLGADDRLTIATRQLQGDLGRLLAWAAEHQLALEELRAVDASLAEIFHRIAGRDGEDDPGEAAAPHDPEVHT